MMKKIIIPIACFIIALIIVLMSFVGPWYNMNINGSVDTSSTNGSGIDGGFSAMIEDMEINVDYYLRNVRVKSNFFGMPFTQSISYSDLKEQSEQSDVQYGSMVADSIVCLFYYSFYLSLVVLVLLVLSLVFSVIYLLSNGVNVNLKKLALVFGHTNEVMGRCGYTDSLYHGNHFWTRFHGGPHATVTGDVEI